MPSQLVATALWIGIWIVAFFTVTSPFIVWYLQ